MMDSTATAATLAALDNELGDHAPEWTATGDERRVWLLELVNRRHRELFAEQGIAEYDGAEGQVKLPPRLRDMLTGESPEGERDNVRLRFHFSEPEV